MPNKNKKRGNTFERRVAQIFSEHLNMGFVRTPNSGGWGKAQTGGDIVCLSVNNFPYLIECKKTKELPLWLMLRPEGWPRFNSWWKQASTNARKENRKPAVVFSKDQSVIMVAIESNNIYVDLQPSILTEHVQIITLDKFLEAIKNHKRLTQNT